MTTRLLLRGPGLLLLLLLAAASHAYGQAAPAPALLPELKLITVPDNSSTAGAGTPLTYYIAELGEMQLQVQPAKRGLRRGLLKSAPCG